MPGMLDRVSSQFEKTELKARTDCPIRNTSEFRHVVNLCDFLNIDVFAQTGTVEQLLAL